MPEFIQLSSAEGIATVARDLMFTGRTVSASEALTLGIVSRVAIARANLSPTTRTLDP